MKKRSLLNSFLFLFISLIIFFFYKINANGIIDKKPIKNLAPLKVKGPILSIPVSCAINVVPQIKVHKKAVNRDIDLDIIFKLLICMQNLYLNFLEDEHKI